MIPEFIKSLRIVDSKSIDKICHLIADSQATPYFELTLEDFRTTYKLVEKTRSDMIRNNSVWQILVDSDEDCDDDGFQTTISGLFHKRKQRPHGIVEKVHEEWTTHYTANIG